MRPGSWDGRVSTDNVRVTVNGTVRPVERVQVTSGMRDGHPRAEGTQWCVTSEIVWANPDDVTAGSPEPFSIDSWLPRVGDTVLIETGDAALNQWWVKHRGVIDDTTGSIADGTARSTTVDRIDELGGPVSMLAALGRSVPAIEGQPWRQVGMSSTFLIDRMLRHTHDISGTAVMGWTGWYATPPPTWQTVGSAPCMGSLIAEVGYVREADRKSAPGTGGPDWHTTPYGVTPTNFTARYDLSSPASTPILSMGILNEGSGVGSIAVTDDAGKGLRILYNRATGNVAVAVIGVTPVQAWSVPLGSNRRVAAYLQRTGASSQTVRLRMEDGTESLFLGAATDLPAGWAATRVVVDTEIPLGWWMVENNKPVEQRWFTIDQKPSAIVRIGPTPNDHGFMEASRDIYLDDSAQWLQEQVDAECSAMWMDEDRLMQYAGRGVLDAQPIVQTVTSDLDLDDVLWEARGRQVTRNLSIKYAVPTVEWGHQGRADRTLWEGSASDLAGGEEDVTLVNVPDDEDWFSVDTTPHHISEWGRSWDYYTTGSTFGGTQYTAATSDAAAWAAFLNCTMTTLNLRSYEVKFGPWSTISSADRVNSKVPPSSTSARAGTSALTLRGRARSRWREAEDLQQINPYGRGVYVHDVGWRVQRLTETYGALKALKEFLMTQLLTNVPTVTGLVVAHDPRRQIGDHITAQDRHRTGLQFNVLCQQVTFDSDSFTDTISGRTTSSSSIPGLSLHRAPTPGVLAPPTDWNRSL